MIDAIKRMAANYTTSLVWGVVFCWLIGPHVIIANLHVMEQYFGMARTSVECLERFLADVLWPLGTLILAIVTTVRLMRTADDLRRDEIL